MIDQQTLQNLTLEYGGEWGRQHSLRLMHLVKTLGEGIEYDAETIALAAWMHDWGGYARFMQPEVEHYDRSRQVAEGFLKENGCSPALAARVLECIACHHGGPAERSIESRLFTDADALDLLGTLGALRIFAMNSRDLRGGLRALKHYRDTSMAALTTERGKIMAIDRLAETDRILEDFERETFGIY